MTDAAYWYGALFGFCVCGLICSTIWLFAARSWSWR